MFVLWLWLVSCLSSAQELCRPLVSTNVTLIGSFPWTVDLATAGVPVVVMPSALPADAGAHANILSLELFVSDSCVVDKAAFVIAANNQSVELRTSIASLATGAQLSIPYTADAFGQCAKPHDTPTWFETFPGCGDFVGCRHSSSASAVAVGLTTLALCLNPPPPVLLTALAGVALAQTAPDSTATAEVSSAAPTTTAFVTNCVSFVRARVFFILDATTCKKDGLVAVANFTSGSQPLGGVTAEVEQHICAGRPFVVDNAAVLARASGTTSDERAARWVSQGLGEHASVASFAAFSLQLLVNGAPFALLAGAARANGDEVRHAEQSFSLASRFAGRAITAEAFPRRAVSALEPQTLEELAEATLREGCIAETLSVFEAARRVAAGDVVDAEERAVLVGIVRDEARHSALAWRTVAWASGAALNEPLNARLTTIVADEQARCADAHQCELFARLIVPLAKRAIGARDWEQIVNAPEVEIPAAADLVQGAITTILQALMWVHH
jgi:hypothetical protein